MSFTNNNNFEGQAQGQADWDSGINANFNIADRGFHGKFTTAIGVNTGDLLSVLSGGLVAPHNPRSLSLRAPNVMAYKAVASGATDYFLLRGIVTSISVWSGKLVTGEPVYSSATSPGFAVSSFSAAAFPAGLALRQDAIYFNPGGSGLPEKISQVQSLGPLAIGSTHSFTLSIGNRGFIRRVEGVTSFNNWTMTLWSGSARVSSEMVFQTASGGVTSTYLLDAAGFPYEATDAASLGLLFGSVVVNSGVGSAYFNLNIVAERMR